LERDNGFAGTDIALQQAVHAQGGCHVGGNFSDGAGLSGCGGIGQTLQDAVLQGAGAVAGNAFAFA
jgi:hypothetical protein